MDIILNNKIYFFSYRGLKKSINESSLTDDKDNLIKDIDKKIKKNISISLFLIISLFILIFISYLLIPGSIKYYISFILMIIFVLFYNIFIYRKYILDLESQIEKLNSNYNLGILIKSKNKKINNVKSKLVIRIILLSLLAVFYFTFSLFTNIQDFNKKNDKLDLNKEISDLKEEQILILSEIKNLLETSLDKQVERKSILIRLEEKNTILNELNEENKSLRNKLIEYGIYNTENVKNEILLNKLRNENFDEYKKMSNLLNNLDTNKNKIKEIEREILEINNQERELDEFIENISTERHTLELESENIENRIKGVEIKINESN